MSTPHHCRYATVGSKSGSEVGFWTSSDVQIWGSVTIALVHMKEAERGEKKESALVMFTVLAINIAWRCKRKHRKNRTNQVTIASSYHWAATGKSKSTVPMITTSIMNTVERHERKNHHSSWALPQLSRKIKRSKLWNDSPWSPHQTLNIYCVFITARPHSLKLI